MTDRIAELESQIRHLESANEQLAASRNEWLITAENRWKHIQETEAKLTKMTDELGHAQAVITAREETINELAKAPHLDLAVENAALKQSLETVKALLRKHQNSAPAKRAAKLEEKVAELEQTIERMHAARIYQECNPEATEADLQLKIVHQQENFASALHEAEGVILEWQEKYKRAEDNINALEAIKARMHSDLSQANLEVYNIGQKHSQAQAKIADLERVKEQLTAALAQASKHACDWQERCNQANAKITKLEEQNDSLAAQIDLWIERVEELKPEQIEAQAARIALLEQDLRNLQQANKELEQGNSQAAATVSELLTKYQEISADNCNLLAANRELEEHLEASSLHHDEIACPSCALKDQRIAQLQELTQFNNGDIGNLQEDIRWQERAAACDEIEAATKLVAAAMRKACKPGGAYTKIYTEDIAKATGMKRQAAGRHMNAAVEWGLFSGYRLEEKATVPDTRLGKREIKKKILHIAPTELLERPEDWKRGDGKQHGGAGRRCKKCGAENTLRQIPHTVCLHCGAEDIFYPDDAREALDRTHNLQPEDAQAAVAKAVAIMAQTASVTDVHDEQQSDLEAAHALLAKMKEYDCILYIRQENNELVISVPDNMNSQSSESLKRKVIALEIPLRQILAETDVHHEQQPHTPPETSFEEQHVKRIDAWGAARGYPKAQMSNGVTIPDGPIAWRGFCKYRTDLHQQAYEDICNGTLKEAKG